MKHYKDENNLVYAYEEDGSQDAYIPSHLIPITNEEADAIRANIMLIPTVVSMRQARLALLQSGLLETVNTAIAAGGEADKITWEYATEVNRTDALVSNMAAALGLTEAQLDQLFTLAASL